MKRFKSFPEELEEFNVYKDSVLITGMSDIKDRYQKLIESSYTALIDFTKGNQEFVDFVMSNEKFMEQFDNIVEFLEEKKKYVLGNFTTFVDFIPGQDEVQRGELGLTPVTTSVNQIDSVLLADNYYLHSIMPKINIIYPTMENESARNEFFNNITSDTPLTLNIAVLHELSFYFEKEIVFEEIKPDMNNAEINPVRDFDSFINNRISQLRQGDGDN